MGSKNASNLHIIFFPFMAQGHSIPAADIAKLFASRGGVKVTIITTPLSNPLISKSIHKTQKLGFEIDTLIINFPCAAANLPDGCESLELTTSPEMKDKFFGATAMLEHPLEQILLKHRPDCLIADFFFPWATRVAQKYGIPRIVFHGTCFFSLCVFLSLRIHEPHKKVSSDSEIFVIPNLPGEIKMTRAERPSFDENTETCLMKLLKEARESELASYGVIVNSFYELEPDYADHYGKFQKAWHIGPVSLCNMDNEDKAWRGKESAIDDHECWKWLNLKKPNSVIYLCFGSGTNFTDSQLMEIAMGLKASGQNFIWVVRKNNNHDKEAWLPENFERKTEGKGLIIRGWAPQVLILDHEAVGGFVTHCGWNSVLEGVCAGVPMVTWPVNADQFYNEKLVTQILKIGVAVGVKKWVRFVGDFVGRERIATAVRRVMVGEEAEEMMTRTTELKELAGKAIGEGGSSWSDLNDLIEELRFRRGGGHERKT